MAFSSSLLTTFERGDEFVPRSGRRGRPKRRARIVGKVYQPDMTITYRMQQVGSNGKVIHTSVSERVLRHHYKRVLLAPRVLYSISTREIFVGMEPADGAEEAG